MVYRKFKPGSRIYYVPKRALFPGESPKHYGIVIPFDEAEAFDSKIDAGYLVGRPRIWALWNDGKDSVPGYMPMDDDNYEIKCEGNTRNLPDWW